MTTELEGGITQMCNLSEGIYAEGREEGRLEEKLYSIKNLMDSTGWTVDEVLEALKIPENERKSYKDKIIR